MRDENGEFVWRTIRGARVKIYKNKTLTESIRLQKQNADKYKDGKLKLKDTTFTNNKETYYQLKNGQKVKFLDKKEYNKMVDDFYDKLSQDEKDAIGLWINDPWILSGNSIYQLKKDYPTIFQNAFKKAETLKEDTLLFRRAGFDYLDIKNGMNIDGNLSTSAYDVLPKTMPSGLKFGDKELYIIAPKGTKVLPVEKIAVKDVASDDTEKRIFTRQHELILPKNTHYEILQDLSTYNKDYDGINKNEKYVVQLTNKKYKEIKYEKPEYSKKTFERLESYIVKKGSDKIEVEEVHKGEKFKDLPRKDAIKYRVWKLAFKHKPEYYDSYEEAVEAINKYL